MNNKFYSLALLALFAGTAGAQSSPPGVAVPPHTPGIASDKAQRAGEARKEMRPDQAVNPRGGDMPKVAEGGAVGTDKAARAGERRADTRDARRPGKSKPMQGGTPK
ncbi:MAG: cell envelope biogenesis protein TolA [Variovorax sp.]